MRVPARSLVVVVASSAPWMASCLGSGDDTIVPFRTDSGGNTGGDAANGDGASGDAHSMDGTVGDASPPLDGPTGEAMSSDGPAEGAQAPVTTSTVAGLRVANWSPDGPPVDFCLAPHGTNAFVGPVVAGIAGDGGALAFPQVSAYTYLPPGTYDVRIVLGAPGVDCSAGGLLIGDAGIATLGGDAGLKAGTAVTLALIGMAFPPPDSGAPPIQFLSPLSDDPAGPAPRVPLDGAAPTNLFAVRFVHAAPGFPNADLVGTPVDLTGSGISSPKWSFKNVGFGHANPWKDGGTAGGGTDTNGYLWEPALPPTDTLNVNLPADAGAPSPPPAPTVPVAGGGVLTIVLARSALPDGGAGQLLMECVDNGATTNAYSPCRTLSVSTCGNGIREAFEECDCGNGMSTDPQCATPAVAAGGIVVQQNSDDPLTAYVCSSTCHLR